MSKFSFDGVHKCAACFQAKNHKHGPGHGSLRDTTATIPYQGLYVDFAHTGQIKYDEDGFVDEASRSETEGLNGEGSWILISDAHTRMFHGGTRCSKTAPLKYLRSWLNQYAPPKHLKKWLVLDQGGEVFGNPEVHSLFREFG